MFRVILVVWQGLQDRQGHQVLKDKLSILMAV